MTRTTYAKKRQTPFERVKLIGGGALFGLFAFGSFANIPGSEGVIFGLVCAVLSIVGIVSGMRGYDELKKR